MTTIKEWREAWFPESDKVQKEISAGIKILEAANLTVFNKNGWGGPITLGDEKIEHGICVDALEPAACNPAKTGKEVHRAGGDR